MNPIDDMSVFHAAFFDEARELLDDLEEQLLVLESTPNDSDLLNTIFRCAHSIKGGSATFGLTDIAHFTHGLETLLDRVRKGQIPVDQTIVEILLASLDHMRALVAVASKEIAAAPDASELSRRIEVASGATASPILAPNVAKSVQLPKDEQFSRRFLLHVVPANDVLRQGADPALLVSKLHTFTTIESIVCDGSSVPQISEIDPEESYLSWSIYLTGDVDVERVLDLFSFIMDGSEITCEEIVAEGLVAVEAESVTDAGIVKIESAAASTTASDSASLVGAGKRSTDKTDASTLRVSTDKIDTLINLVGELVINQSMLNTVIADFSMLKLPQLLDAVARMERNSREIQDRVMAIRMLPIKHAFGRFPRLVRDMASTVGKKIDLKTVGEETELDKTVIDLIVDPLTHLVRNSIDHGLETPEVRLAAGKPATGTITLNAFHEGGSIIIEISDDGKGLDRDIIVKKAIDKGLISESDVLTSDIIDNLIFLPGFSTAKEITDISGRGVGMDIVKRSVLSLGGSISLTSTINVGTRFRIRLPLTMAILEGLSVSVGNETYILPLTSIVESIQPKSADVRMVAGLSEVVTVRGRVLPVLRLHNLFGIKTAVTDPTKAILVIIEHDEKQAALLVDELIGQNQVVLKSLDDNYQRVPGIAGATILGDGQVAFILDVAGIVHGIAASELSTQIAA